MQDARHYRDMAGVHVVPLAPCTRASDCLLLQCDVGKTFRSCPALGANPFAVPQQVLKELGMQMHAIEETFVDMARTLFTLGIARPVMA